MSYRVLTAKTIPSSEHDAPMVTTFNRIITNTLEQTFIFAGLYASFYDGKLLNPQLTLAIASMFIIGRISYAFGYAIGSYTRLINLRAFGVVMNFNLNLMLILQLFGVNAVGFLQGIGNKVISMNS